MKWIIGIVSAVIAFSTMASLSGGGNRIANYDTLDDASQQEVLDQIASGFKAGFNLTAGKRAEITQIYTDTSYDLVSISVQYNDKRIETAPADAIERTRQMLTKQTCKLANKQKMLERGITMRIRMHRPSGARMGTVQVDPENCARYIS